MRAGIYSARLVTTTRAAAGGALCDLSALFDLEGVAAAARGDDVRVVDLEARLLDRLEVVDLGALEIRGAERVDDHPDALKLELVIAVLDAAVETERVLEAGAAAALHCDPQHGRLAFRLVRHQPTDLL